MKVLRTQTAMLSINLDQPFRLSFGELYTLPRVIYEVELEDGTKGYGEASIDFPFSNYDMYDVYFVLNNVDISSKKIEDRVSILEDNDLRKEILQFPAAFTAFNMALDDAYGKYKNISVSGIYGSTREGGLAMESISFQEDTPKLLSMIRDAQSKNYLPKFKVGNTIEKDVELIRFLNNRRISHALDFNAAYCSDIAIDILDAVIKETGLDSTLYIEQPTDASLGTGALVSVNAFLKETNVNSLVVADESFMTLEDATRCVEANIALNFKLHRIGGLYVAKQMENELLKNYNFSSMIGGTFPTAIGRSYDQYAACCLSTASLHSDGLLPSTTYFQGNKHLINQEFSQSDLINPIAGAGMGAMVNQDKLKLFVVHDPTAEYKKIRSNFSGKQLNIKITNDKSYRDLYEEKSERKWDWNLK